MSKFVSKEPVLVTIDGDPHTIYIRPKMDFGTLNRVRSLAAHFKAGQNGAGDALDIDLGAWNMALLSENIVRWEGPEYDGVAITPDSIGRLDPDDPLVDAVLSKIQEFNFTPGEGTSPNGRTTATNKRSKASSGAK